MELDKNLVEINYDEVPRGDGGQNIPMLIGIICIGFFFLAIWIFLNPPLDYSICYENMQNYSSGTIEKCKAYLKV